jgi:long-chain acyl-CoA synthetase
VLERLVDYIYFYRAVSVAYCNVPDLAEALRRVKPHLFTAVPRVYEKIHDRVHEEVARAGGLKHAIFRAAAAEAHESVRRGRRGVRWHLFDKLVYAKIRAAFGGRVRFSISGGAPLPVFVGEFFHGADVLVLEGYGLTETSPVIAANRLDANRLGSVGQVVPDVEVRIAADGEILTRGPHVMRGYWNKPEATAETIDPEGWLHTGDIGYLDSDGYLFITDRKKDIIVTSGGKNVAPQPIEGKLGATPYIAQAVVIGDKYPYLTALIVPNFENLEAYFAEHGSGGMPRETIARDERTERLIGDTVKNVNRELAMHERVRRFTVLGREFSLEEGELTPTMKVRRRVVGERYRELIEGMYLKTQRAGDYELGD